jgi:hypothetical protein
MNPVYWRIDWVQAASADEEREFAIPPGTWRLVAADFLPSTTAALHATNHANFSLNNGLAAATGVIGTLTNVTVAFTKGTARSWTLDPRYTMFVGGTDILEIATVNDGAGAVVDGCISLQFEKIRI